MRTDFTIASVMQSACAGRNQHLVKDKPVKKKRTPKVSKEKTWIQFRLEEFSKETGVPLATEYQFDEVRRWRFDWCFPSIKLAVEYEGGIFMKISGHNTPKHYTKDANKYNSAGQQGWTVLRFTALNYLDLTLELAKLEL